METWDDCLAALRAGAPPEDVLPRVRQLFSQLPPAPKTPTPPQTPLSRLRVGLPYKAGTAQIPYLRPPFHTWSTNQDEKKTLFDSEMDFDLVQLFQPMFIAPPEPEVKEMLKEATLGAEPIDEMEVSETQEQQGEKSFTIDDIERYAKEIERVFDEDASVPAFPAMGTTEWAAIFSQVDTLKCTMVKHFLLSVNQPTLAFIILYSVVPRLVYEDLDQVIEVVDLAAANAELHTLPISEVRSMLELYRSLDVGVMSALAQLKVMSYLNKR